VLKPSRRMNNDVSEVDDLKPKAQVYVTNRLYQARAACLRP
jgi:hypothetical protein